MAETLDCGGRSATTCVVADDHPMVLDSLARLLEAEGVLVVGRGSTGPQALKLLRERQPDLAVLDVRMPGLTGLEVARAAAAEGLPSRIVIYSMYLSPKFVRDALALGVAAIVRKEATPDKLLEALQAVREGGTYVDFRGVRARGDHS